MFLYTKQRTPILSSSSALYRSENGICSEEQISEVAPPMRRSEDVSGQRDIDQCPSIWPVTCLAEVVRSQTRVIWIVAVTFCVTLSAEAQQTDDLQRQLQRLEQRYEQTTRELQEQIAALQQQIQKRDETKQLKQKKREPFRR